MTSPLLYYNSFSMIIQELKNFMHKVSSDITKIIQACTTAQENMGKLIDNTISQDLAKPQGVPSPNPTIDSRTFGVNHMSKSSYEINWTLSWPKPNLGMPPQSNNAMYHPQRPYEIPTSPHAYVNQQHPNQTPFNFNQSIIKLFICQTNLTHSTQWLNQQATNALNNTAKSSSFHENQHFINDIPIFKAKDPQLFDEWLEQIDKYASLTIKDPYKPALAKSQGSFSRTISSFPHALGWNKINEQLCYNFDSVATKQYATSMIID